MTRWSAGSIAANGSNLHYYRTGGNKAPLVLAHGLTDSGLCWAPLVRTLEADYDCIMVDARGHGWSDAPDIGYTNTEHAADYAALIETLQLEKPAIMGHSMGGGTGAQLAASYPELLRAAVLEDPPWRPQGGGLSTEERRANAEQWRADVSANRTKSLEALIAAGRQRSPYGRRQSGINGGQPNNKCRPKRSTMPATRPHPGGKSSARSSVRRA